MSPHVVIVWRESFPAALILMQFNCSSIWFLAHVSTRDDTVVLIQPTQSLRQGLLALRGLFTDALNWCEDT